MKTPTTLLVVALLLSSCTTLHINYDYDPQVDFTTYRTYRWGESDPKHDVLENHKLLRKKIVLFSDSILKERNLKLVKDTTVAVDFEIVVFGILKSDTSLVTTSDGPAVGVGFGYGGYGGHSGYGYRGYGYGGFAPTGSYNSGGDPAKDGGYGNFGPVGGGSYYPTAVAVGVGGNGGSRSYLDVHQEGTIVFDFVDPETKSLVWRSAAQKTVQEYKTAKQADAVLVDILAQVYANFPPPTKKR